MKKAMNNVPKPSKRIVSKGEYVAVQTSRALLRTSALISLVEVTVCVVLALGLVLSNSGWVGGLLALAFASMAVRLASGGVSKLRQAARLEQVLPLTPANADRLPPTQTLVRAASAPPQEQQAVLLRAAGSEQATSADQLLRATDDFAKPTEPPVSERHVATDEAQAQTPPLAVHQSAATPGQEVGEEHLVKLTGGSE